MKVEAKLESMGLSLPEVAKPLASYVPAIRAGSFVFTSGQLPLKEGNLVWRGHVGAEVSQDEAYQAARLACLNALAAIKSEASDLDRIERIVRLTGYVNSAESFTNQPVVVNGASDLLVELFGDAGRHSRSSVGVSELPLDAPVEIDLVVAIRD